MKEVFIKMVLDAWNTKIKETDNLLDKLTDEQLLKEISPNKNRGIYLLGHLVAVNDNMLPLLNFGEQLYPQLDDIFINNPDKSKPITISAAELRQYWKSINLKLSGHIGSLQAEEWFQKHNSISMEDFQKEQHRNKLNIIINRTNHLSYHLGQLVLLKN